MRTKDKIEPQHIFACYSKSRAQLSFVKSKVTSLTSQSQRTSRQTNEPIKSYYKVNTGS